MTPSEIDQAHKVRAEMLDVLAPLAVSADPTWRFRRESGVLDPLAYMLREAGDTDYWSELDDSGTTGFDLAVSLVLDTSGSMNGQIEVLGISAIGIRLACDELGIPCTVSTFNDDTSILFDATDQTEMLMVSATGGTQPLAALEDLPQQRAGKARHLVVVFTDGIWEDVPSMAPFRRPGITAIGIALGESRRSSLAERQFDGMVVIEQAQGLVALVQNALVDLVPPE